jgi:DNA-binding SARP family transcriptional activator/tetratricopeptide (TPR) repeat protein
LLVMSGTGVAAGPSLTISVLGPFEVEVDGRPIAVGGPRLRTVLALLAVDAGALVSVAALVDGLWGPRPPADADRTARAYVSRLRRRLGDDGLIVARSPGYALRAGVAGVDAARFESLVALGRRELTAGRPAVAAGLLADALGQWRGEPYGEFGESAPLRVEAARLCRARLAAVEDRIEADLAAGRGGELVAELTTLTSGNPGHERLWGQLMRALYRAGRQADALAAYDRARRTLVEEAGLEPSPPLVDIHRRVLAQDPGLLAGAAPPPVVAAAPAGCPRQLPPAVRGFTGRAAELAALDALLPGPAGEVGPVAVVISALSGTAGVGKTALAVYWAHRVADRFPDGTLYVNLRGFDPAGDAAAVEPAEAVRGFLDALGVPADRIPAGLDQMVARYRSLLAGRRTMVVLDNARNADQVRPLLPGTPTAMVLVTSRDRLTPLLATEGAHTLSLAVLSSAAATALLAGRLGADRLAAEPAAAEALVARCARLPLALAVVAARAAADPGLPLATLAGELAPVTRLDALTAGDAGTDVRAVLSWSYRALSPATARLFRLLGLRPDAEITLPAAAALADQPPPEVGRLLAQLVRANLLTEPAPGRWGSHDLLTAYATEAAAAAEPAPVRQAATDRLLAHYLHTAEAADRLLDRARDPSPLPLGPVPAGAAPEGLADRTAALAWLTAHRATLLAAQRLAAASGRDAVAWQLARALTTYLDRQGHWDDLMAAWGLALAAARRLDTPGGTAEAHRFQARVHLLRGADRAGAAELHRANAAYATAGDPVGRANVHLGLAALADRPGHHQRALGHARQALELYRRAGHHRGQANAHNTVAWHRGQLGDHRGAVADCRRALRLFQHDGDTDGEAATWDTLGYALHQLGRHTASAASYRRALALFRALRDYYYEADTLLHLGEVRAAAGDLAGARADRERALAILSDLDHPRAAEAHALLDTG